MGRIISFTPQYRIFDRVPWLKIVKLKYLLTLSLNSKQYLSIP